MPVKRHTTYVIGTNACYCANVGAKLFAVDLDEVGDAMKQDLQLTSRRKRLGKNMREVSLICLI